ncbi:MAG: hypothetical protein GEU28_07870 [Dehalococcoidia bacterium]|nr:hypothetical protein [Dehalococcoidia bacterium]
MARRNRSAAGPPKAPTTPRPRADRGSAPVEYGEGTRLILVGGVAILAIAVIGVIGYLLVRSLFPSNPVVLRVGDEDIRLNYYAARLETFLVQQGGLTDINQVLPIANILLQDIAQEEIILQSLDEAGVEVTDDDVQIEIERRIGVTEEEDFARYRQGLIDELDRASLNEDQYRHLVSAELARTRMQDTFQQEQVQETVIPFLPPLSFGPHASFNQLNLGTEEEAADARQRLLDGEDFTTVALELDPAAVPPESGSPFQPVFILDQAVQDAIETLEAEAISDVLETSLGFSVVQLIDKGPHLLSEGDHAGIAQSRFDEFLEERREAIGVEEDLSDSEIVDAFEKAA